MQLQKHSTSEEVAPFIQMLGHGNPLNLRMVKFITQHTFPQKIKKGKLLLKSGEVCTHIFFIVSGVLRGFLKDDTKDITTWITVENEMAAAINSFIYQTKTVENIQAIEDCELLAISYNDMELIYTKFPVFNYVARKIYETYYADAENRALLGRLKNADSKYQHFLKTQGRLAKRIPLKYIASYMGITLETLSRLRSKNAAALKK